MTINDDEYYESNTATTSDTQDDIKCNMETVTHTLKRNETFNYTSNEKFEQKILSNQSIPVLTPAMNPWIDQGIAPIVLAPQTLLTPETKEVVTDAASSRAWINRTLRQVSRMGVKGSTPGYIPNNVSIVEPPYLVLIEMFGTSPPCGFNVSKHVENKRQSTSPGLVGQTKKLDATVDRKLRNDLDSGSFFSKVIGHKLSHGSSGDFYKRCRINFVADPVQTQTTQLMDIGLETINELDEISGINKPATRILRPAKGSHRSTPNHVLGETTSVGVSEANSDYNYNYKTELQIWKENKEFERKTILMS